MKHSHRSFKKNNVANELPENNPVVPSVTAPIKQGNIIEININGETVKALIDTGAMVSCMSPNVYNSISAKFLLQQSKHSKVQGVGGNAIYVQGQCNVEIFIGNERFKQIFHVLEAMSYPVILGDDFLSQNKAIIDFSKQILRLPSVSVNLLKSEHVPIKTSLARSIQDIDIPAKSECLIRIKLNNGGSNKCSGLLEPISSLTSRTSLMGARCVISSDSSIKVYRVFNPTKVTISIKRNQPLARFLPTDGIDILQTHISDEDAPALCLNNISVQPDEKNIQLANELGINIDNSDLSVTEKRQLLSLIGANRDCFAKDLSELSTTDVYHHEIKTGDAQPRRRTFYRASPTIQKAIDSQVEDLLRTGKIEPSLSEWAAPIVMVKKKSGDYRMAIDYRGINQITEPIHFPLPRFESVTDTISAANAKVFSTLDLMSGYFQIPVHPNSKHKTAFVTASGQYQFNVMPFGLRNAPHAFQMVMSQALRTLNWKSVIVYIDDTLVFSQTFSEHLKHLNSVFQCLREAKLKLKPNKCHFAAKEVEYLGHLISKDGLKPNPDKVKVVENFQTPTKVKDVRSFLGLSNYYRRFIKNYSALATPLTNILKKDAKFKWTEQCHRSFIELKKALTSSPILMLPNFNKEFILYTDASDQAISYILGQKDDQGRERVIEYGARAIRPFEKSWHTTDKEGLALVTGVLHYHTYLADQEFTVYTDHSALKSILNNTSLKGRLSRWALLLQQYRMKIVHKPGKHNTNADALSRSDVPIEQHNDDEISINLLQTGLESKKYEYHFTYATEKACLPASHLAETSKLHEPIVKPPELLPVTTKPLAQYQWEDEELKPIMMFLEDQTNLPSDDKKARALVLQAPDYSLHEGVLYHHHYIRGKGPKADCLCQQIVVPKALRDDVLRSYHDSPLGGHQGEDRTFNGIRMKYFWKIMSNDIITYVKTCQQCQQAKRNFRGKNAPL